MVVALANIQRGEASGQRIMEILDTKIEVADHPDAVALQSFDKLVEFKNVCFGYSDRPVLTDISFTIEKEKPLHWLVRRVLVNQPLPICCPGFMM